jgi:RNA polymerase sigma-70 factor (ECF subfamily)
VASDRDLIERCLQGDASALRVLVIQYQNDVFTLCFRMLRHRQDAEDVTQETFLKMTRGLKTWDPSRPFRPWLLSIAMNCSRTWLAKRGKRAEPCEFTHELPDPRSHDDPEGNELAVAVRVAVDSLRDDYREVFLLYHETGQGYDEIAAIVNRPVGTIKTWLHRARHMILEQLTQSGLVSPAEKPHSS